ncbi:hypothetical protein PG993_008573 [Apiospora rasikravindrae]|uniref:C3H1-type domain-containing protein n=1 Tax=Apiospora rasikravindrae TaxID=990691 RepID=A0ABR1T150_9PEZI
MADVEMSVDIAPGYNPLTARAEYTKYLNMDASRNSFISSLIQHLDDCTAKIQGLEDNIKTLNEKSQKDDFTLSEFKTEAKSPLERLHALEKEAATLREENKELGRYLNDDYIDNPFVAVVVDGDGAIFTDELLKDPALAAEKLKAAIRAQLLEMHSLPIGIPIMVRIYANLHGLAKTVAANMIINYNDVVEFPSRFNFECDYFDFVDVGQSKEAANSKIRSRSEFKRFGLPIKSFPNVFRTDMLQSPGAFKRRRESQEQPAPPLQMDQYRTGSDAALEKKDSYPIPVGMGSPTQTATTVRELLQDKRRNRIFYNRSHVRIDRILKHPGDLNEPHQISLERKKNGRKGFCNDYYLVGRCKRGAGCDLIHDVTLDDKETGVLRWLACTRYRCFKGGNCRDFYCYFPHTCPIPKYECRRECGFKVHLDIRPDSDDRKPKYALIEGHNMNGMGEEEEIELPN